MPVALAERARLVAPDDRFTWQVASDLRPEVSDDVVAELRVGHQVHTPGEWCSAG